ncbi:MAG TPA: hypothetical protein VF721_22325 [Pyrinomonadaceae bacterium]
MKSNILPFAFTKRRARRNRKARKPARRNIQVSRRNTNRKREINHKKYFSRFNILIRVFNSHVVHGVVGRINNKRAFQRPCLAKAAEKGR